MSHALRIALLLLGLTAFCAPAGAQEVEVATSIFCDTQSQVEQFVDRFDGDVALAAGAVNAEANSPNACMVAKVAHVRGIKLSESRKKDTTFQIVKILVLGIETPVGMQPVAPGIYFGAVKVEEVEA